VWFQNKRAKFRKMERMKQPPQNPTSGSGTGTGTQQQTTNNNNNSKQQELPATNNKDGRNTPQENGESSGGKSIFLIFCMIS
jgi:hypothetical protein